MAPKKDEESHFLVKLSKGMCVAEDCQQPDTADLRIVKNAGLTLEPDKNLVSLLPHNIL